MDLVTRIDLLIVSIYAGGVYAVFRIGLTLFYPPIVTLWWQGVVGPLVQKRWPAFVQSENTDRFSYLSDGRKPAVLTYNFTADVDDLTHGIRDGVALGLLVALLPEIYTPALFTFLLTFVITHGIWTITKKGGAEKTDSAFVLLRRIFMWGGAISAVYIANIAS